MLCTELSRREFSVTFHPVFSGLAAFEHEGIQNITTLKDQLVSGNHEQSESIIKRHGDVIARWNKLLNDSLERKNKLLVMQVCTQVFGMYSELYLIL